MGSPSLKTDQVWYRTVKKSVANVPNGIFEGEIEETDDSYNVVRILVLGQTVGSTRKNWNNG